MSFQVKLILGVGCVLLIASGFLFLWPDSEAEQDLKVLVENLFSYAKEGDAETCLEYVYEHYNFEGEKYEDVARKARRYIARPEAQEYELKSVEIDDQHNIARLLLKADFFGRKIPVTLVLHFSKFQDKWKVTGYHVFRQGS